MNQALQDVIEHRRTTNVFEPTYQPKTDLAGCLNNSTRRTPTDTLAVDPVNDPSSRAEK
jgi:hypothetical protein